MTKPAIINTAISRCEEHGTFENSLVESFIGDAQWQGCPRCHFDARHSADASVATAARDVQFARQLNADLLASGIPLRFRVATLENYRTDSKPEPQAVALRQCREYAEGFAQHWQVGLSMMLLGEVGTGKTHLGCAVAQHVIRHHGAHVRYTSALAIIRDVKATFSKTAESTEHQVFSALQVPDLLVIDEIGVQHGSDFERQVLFEVINNRYERLQPTIVISNLGILGLRKCLGDRAVDRLSDAGGPAVLFNWPSARGEA